MEDTNPTRRAFLGNIGPGMAYIYGPTTDKQPSTPPSATNIALKANDVNWAFDPKEVDIMSDQFETDLRNQHPLLTDADIVQTAFMGGVVPGMPPTAESVTVVSPDGLPTIDALDDHLRDRISSYAEEWNDRVETTIAEQEFDSVKQWTVEITDPTREVQLKDVTSRRTVEDTLLVTSGYTATHHISAVALSERSLRLLTARRRQFE